MENVTQQDSYRQFVADIKQRIRQAQYQALKAVNKEQIQLYWELGQLIVERQNQHGWGKAVVEQLASELQAEFAGISGFSARNLWRMRAFYTQYVGNTLILPPMVAEISWSHNLVVMEKCKDDHERLFYIRQTQRNGWSRNVLIHQIEVRAYQKTLLNQQNFEQTMPEASQATAALTLKDEYTFDFLNLSDAHSEYELEQAILANIRRFLIEMGADFSFIGNQYVIELDGVDYRIDLLLYHRELRSLVAIELKIDGFRPEYAGKMNFYLSLLNKRVRKAHENPSIGIIICKDKSRTTVEFALQDISKPIGVATYSLTNQLPDNLRPFFPSSEEFVRRIEAVSTWLNQ
ncbi:PDDEXK nuclease domain-containing protein [Spirosoma spitsbergense]|uniref:PDDEXK nuclease domain-containing protein n=1 Tax=Spirosoma spitsbergense TaxID=431554 RepID=UPI00037DAC9B|nr:PDDEXK nuclease domain-containing protein [Spirosoma spitsbergense]